MSENDFDVIGIIVDPRDLNKEQWQEVIKIAAKYIENGEHAYKAAVMAYFDYLGEADTTAQH